MGKWIDMARSYGGRDGRDEAAIGANDTIGTVRPWSSRQRNAGFSSANGANDTIGTRTPHAAMPGSQPPTVDQIAHFHERAAIAEFDGGLPRAHAEVLAAFNTLDLRPEAGGILDIVARRLEFLAKAGEIS